MRPLLVGLLLASPLSLASCDATSYDRAQAAANAWVAGHAGGWNLKIESSDSHDAFTILRPNPCPNGSLMLSSSTTRGDVNLLFHCPSADIIDLAGLQASFSDYHLGTLPVDVGAAGWMFQALATTTSLRSDVMFESWDGVEVALRIEAPLSELLGLSLSSGCATGGDVAPDGCLFQVPYAGPLVLEMRVPLSPDAVGAQVP